jgi:hypothetical protein
LRQADITVILGVDHAMPLQDPDAVGRVISTFVHRHGARRRLKLETIGGRFAYYDELCFRCREVEIP